MFPEYSHAKCESLAQITTPIAEIQNFFLGDCFLLAHRVYMQTHSQADKQTAD